MTRQETIQLISEQMDRMEDYGQLQIFVKKHKGAFMNIDVNYTSTKRFTDTDPNVTAAGDILTLLKAATASSASIGKKTTLGFNVIIDERGQANIMQVQDFKKL